MKRVAILFVLLTVCVFPMKAEVIVLTGVYQGKDIYVKNPETSSGVGFCIFEVLVNGQISADEVNSPSFAIDLAAFDLRIGAPVEIVLRCKENCPVKILNPEAIYPTSTYEVLDILVQSNGDLMWRTEKESAAIAFAVEQYRWNKWSKIGEVPGKGAPGEHGYSFATFLHSGENKFRVSQLDYRGNRYSKEVTITSSRPEVRLLSAKVSKTIDFSAETEYEMYSEFGVLIKSGRGTSVDVSKLFKGRYYLNFDNQAGVAITKR
jgi:hypothetical protein